jgi:hypothetical protein
MSQPRYDSRVKVRESDDNDASVGRIPGRKMSYWDSVKMMVDASAEDLIRVYGPNCWARHEYIIYPDGVAFLKGPVNQYIHATSSP